MRRRVALMATTFCALVTILGTVASATAPPPQGSINWVRATPAALGRAGGEVEVTAAVTYFTSCRLKVSSNRSLPVVYSGAPRACASGHYAARVVIGPNHGVAVLAIAFAFVARNGTSSATDRFYVDVTPGTPPVATTSSTTTTVLPTTTTTSVTTTTGPTITTGPTTTTGPAITTVAATTTTVALVPAPSPSPVTRTPTAASSTTSTSSTTTTTIPTVGHGDAANWAAYVSTAGPYTSVTGTFTVPGLISGAFCNDEMSEWVGIDGAGDNNLIQAGIGEAMGNPGGGTCTAYSVWAWWEILPAASTGIGIAVYPGNSVTVTISQISGVNWQIQLTDTTDNQGFTKDVTYGPPLPALSSAEWVVEAPYDDYVCKADFPDRPGFCTLSPYYPAVAFSGIGYSGALSGLTDYAMEQGDVAVATPSAVPGWPSGFTIPYTGGLGSGELGSGGLGSGGNKSSLLRALARGAVSVKKPDHPIFEG